MLEKSSDTLESSTDLSGFDGVDPVHKIDVPPPLSLVISYKQKK